MYKEDYITRRLLYLKFKRGYLDHDHTHSMNCRTCHYYDATVYHEFDLNSDDKLIALLIYSYLKPFLNLNLIPIDRIDLICR